MSLRQEIGIVCCVLLGFAALFFHGVASGRVLSAADLLLTWEPWEASRPAAFQAPANKLLMDQPTQVYPWYDHAVRRLRRGELPQWNPLAHCGTPFAGNANVGLFYPLNLILLAIPSLAWGLTVVALVKVCISLAATYALARRLGLELPGALLASLAYSFSGPLIVWLNHPNSTASPWLPASLLAAEELVRRGGRGPFVALAAVTGFHALGSHPETSLHILMATAAYAVLRMVPGFRPPELDGDGLLRFKRTTLAAVAMLLGVGLAAAHLLPFADPSLGSLWRSWPRYARLAMIQEGPISPPFTPLLALVPFLYGTPMDLNFAEDWAPANFNESALYVGILPLVLVVAGARASWRRPALRTLGLVAALGLLLAAQPGPVHQLLTRLPVLRYGAHGRLVLLGALGIAVWGGSGLDAAWRRGASVLGAWLASLAGVGALAAATFTYWSTPVMSRFVLAHLLLATGLLLGAALLVGLSRLASRWGWLGAAFMLPLCMTDLFWFGHRINPAVPAEWVYPDNDSLTQLAHEAGSQRVLSVGRALPPNSGMPYGLRDVRGYNPLYLAAYELLWRETFDGVNPYDVIRLSELRAPHLLNLMGARLILAPGANGELLPEGLELAPWEGGPPHVYHNHRALPRAFVVRRFELASPSPQQAHPLPDSRLTLVAAAARRVGSFDFNPASVVVLERPPELPGLNEATAAALETDSVSLVTDAPEQLLLEVRLEAPGILVVTDAYDEGWRVEVDGRPSRLLRADALFRAVPLTAGEHRVEFRYRTPALLRGLILSLLSLAVLLVVGLRRK